MVSAFGNFSTDTGSTDCNQVNINVFRFHGESTVSSPARLIFIDCLSNNTCCSWSVNFILCFSDMCTVWLCISYLLVVICSLLCEIQFVYIACFLNNINFYVNCSHCNILCWYLKWTRQRYSRSVLNTGIHWYLICIEKAHLLQLLIHCLLANQLNFLLVGFFTIQYYPRYINWVLSFLGQLYEFIIILK